MECIWITTARHQRTFVASTETVGCASICPGARNLRVHFDSHWNLKQHFSNVTKSCYFLLQQLCVVRRSLPSDVLRTLLQVFIVCRLDYCNLLLVGLQACNVSRLQSVQNAAGRLFGGVSTYNSVEHVLRDKFHWLPIVQRIYIHGRGIWTQGYQWPCTSLLGRILCSSLKHLRIWSKPSAARGDFIIPSATKHITHRRWKFAVAEIMLWNSLPLESHSSSSLLMLQDLFCLKRLIT